MTAAGGDDDRSETRLASGREDFREILRLVRPGARVLFRTAAEPSLLPGRVVPEVLDRWHYDVERSARATATDRSSIYGGAHLYVLAD